MNRQRRLRYIRLVSCLVLLGLIFFFVEGWQKLRNRPQRRTIRQAQSELLSASNTFATARNLLNSTRRTTREIGVSEELSDDVMNQAEDHIIRPLLIRFIRAQADLQLSKSIAPATTVLESFSQRTAAQAALAKVLLAGGKPAYVRATASSKEQGPSDAFDVMVAPEGLKSGRVALDTIVVAEIVFKNPLAVAPRVNEILRVQSFKSTRFSRKGSLESEIRSFVVYVMQSDYEAAILALRQGMGETFNENYVASVR